MSVIEITGFQNVILLLLSVISARDLAFQLFHRDRQLFPLVRLFLAHDGVDIIPREFSRTVRLVHTDGLRVGRCVVVEFAGVQDV